MVRRIVVTGGAGFIGSAFIRYVLGAYPDIQVLNFDKLTDAGNLNNVKECDPDRYSFIQMVVAGNQDGQIPGVLQEAIRGAGQSITRENEGYESQHDVERTRFPSLGAYRAQPVLEDGRFS